MARHTTAAIITMAGLALMAAACGGSSRRHGSTATQSGPSRAPLSGAVAFSRCMRSHGVPKFPDPDSGGAIPKGTLPRLGVSSSRFQAAQSACEHLLPNTSDASITECFSTGNCPRALRQQLTNGMLRFARCMRAHGAPSWPDPTRDPVNGSPVFNLVAVHGTDWNSSQVAHELDECQQPGVRIALRRP